MRPLTALATTLAAVTLSATCFAAVPVKHFAPAASALPATSNAPAPAPAFSSAVQAGDTLYVSGTLDSDPATGKVAPDAATGAKVVLDNIKRTVEKAGYTMDDLVWVQVFTSDLKYYADFNAAYRTYFKSPMPARAFIGAGSLLAGAHFEVMGIAVKATKAKG